MREIIGIMACTRLGVIGKDGSVPWNYPSEFKHFQDTTRGHIVIMGRKTFDEMSNLSLLDEHYNIVFSNEAKESDIDNILFVKSIDEFKRISLPQEKKIYMIGGAQIAELFLKKNMIKKFLLTKINKEYDGTVYFPLSLIKGWSSRVVVSHEDYTIYEYKN
ncbi:dihydrofolate reductase [Rickettsiaceae bacterium]|nr:dihydrofolate reductase [Rickettsiaceae bacterium]